MTGSTQDVSIQGVRHWPGLRTEYAWLPPHDDHPTVTGAAQIGVSFTGHRGLTYAAAGRTVVGDIRPGSTIVSGPSPVTWLRVPERNEALEMYPDADLVATTALEAGAPDPEVRQLVGTHDGTVLAIASIFRRAHVADAPLSDVAASSLAHRLAGHLLQRYADVRSLDRASGLLDARAVDRVAATVEDRLAGTLRLEDLAEVASLSAFHFARAFKTSTGLTPYGFVTARRMDRARNLLRTTAAPVDVIAQSVGYANLSHFRRVFRHHHGVSPSALRH